MLIWFVRNCPEAVINLDVDLPIDKNIIIVLQKDHSDGGKRYAILRHVDPLF